MRGFASFVESSHAPPAPRAMPDIDISNSCRSLAFCPSSYPTNRSKTVTGNHKAVTQQ